MSARVRIHETALVEPDVIIGAGTSVWDNVHIRGATNIGHECIVGEKTYIADGVEIGDHVKINAFVYICNAVTIERGVMISAGTVFTNDRFPRATTPDLAALRTSDPDEHTLPTVVREGATIGARATIGCDLEIGRFAMVGMGAIVTRSVPDFHLVIGAPAVSVGCVCRCGEPFLRFEAGSTPTPGGCSCTSCGRRYAVTDGEVVELPPTSTEQPTPRRAANGTRAQVSKRMRVAKAGTLPARGEALSPSLWPSLFGRNGPS